MSFMDKLQGGLEKVVGPIAEKVTTNRFIIAMMEGFMYSMPVTLGTAVIAVLANLPFKIWINFLQSTGLYDVAQDFYALTLSLLAVYIVGAIGYAYTKNQNQNGAIGAVMALASFMVLQPIQKVPDAVTGYPTSMLAMSNMGSSGVFVAILIGLFIPALYCFLMSKNLRLKMPSSVPPMVSQSLSPTFVAMIIFVMLFAVKFVCTLTPYGDLFNMINTVIAQPVAKFGASPVALIVVFTLMNFFWFFGVHPNAILMCYMPVLMIAGQENMAAYLNGEALPYYLFAVLGGCCQIGGAGNTLGLCIATLFAKSEKYKTLRKVFIPANIFNINEPIIFGFPIMLNPIYFIPMVFSPAVTGAVIWVLAKILIVPINPTISMPWVTPGFVTNFLSGGVIFLLFYLLALFIHFIMYLPFFLIDDSRVLKEEKNA